MKLKNYIQELMQKYSEHIICEGETLTSYGSVWEEAKKLAAVMESGKMYGAACKSSINQMTVILACIYSESCFVALTEKYGNDFYNGIVNKLNLKNIVSDDGEKLQIHYIQNDVANNMNNVEKDNTTNHKSVSLDEISEKNIRFILSTSGSSGTPKCVEVSERAIMSNLADIPKVYVFEQGDRVLIFNELFHCGAIFGICTSLMYGADIYFYSGEFCPQSIVSLINSKKITVTSGTPTSFYYIADILKRKNSLPSSLRLVFLAGESMTENVKNRIINTLCNTQFIYFYGMTETCSGATFVYVENDMKCNCVGHAYPSLELQIVDEHDNLCANGVCGELKISGDSLFSGYYNDEKQTEAVFRNGWLYTGDMAYMDNENRMYIVSRKDNMIIRAGVNIYPEKIEQMLENDNNIVRANVYLDRKENSQPGLVFQIVTQHEEKTESIRKRIIEMGLEKIGAGCMPDRIEIVDKINTGVSGKKVNMNK